jgi:hypothetical protein
MPYEPKNFTVVDPRTMEGNPYDVAERAIHQANAVCAVLQHVLEGARLMARNAELSRQMALGQEPDVDAWEANPQAAMLDKILADTEQAKERLKVLARAVGYDPINPPKG